MSFSVNLGCWRSVFAVPSDVVDKGLKLASAYQLRVLLYILRHCEDELSNGIIGRELNMHEEDVKDSIKFWIDRGLIVQMGDELSPGQDVKEKTLVTKTAEKAIDQNKDEEKLPAGAGEELHGYYRPNYQDQAKLPAGADEELPQSRPRMLSRQQRPDSFYVAQRLSEDSDLAALMDEAQIILGKPLSSGDTGTLVMLKETDGLPVDVLIMLLQYCVSIGKGNMRTVEKIGVSWADEGIANLELAENKIRRMKERNNAWNRVSGIFGIKNIGSPTKKQLEYAEKWLMTWCFSDEMLRESYERCVDTKGELNLRYIDGILSRWYNDNIRNVEQIPVLKGKNKKISDKSEQSKASYDIDELEAFSIFD